MGYYIRPDAPQSYREVLLFSIGAFYELQECSYVLFSVFLALRNVATFISGVSLEKTGGYNAGGIVGGIIMIIGLILIIAAGGKKLPDPQSEETAVE